MKPVIGDRPGLPFVPSAHAAVGVGRTDAELRQVTLSPMSFRRSIWCFSFVLIPAAMSVSSFYSSHIQPDWFRLSGNGTFATATPHFAVFHPPSSNTASASTPSLPKGGIDFLLRQVCGDHGYIEPVAGMVVNHVILIGRSAPATMSSSYVVLGSSLFRHVTLLMRAGCIRCLPYTTELVSRPPSTSRSTWSRTFS